MRQFGIHRSDEVSAAEQADGGEQSDVAAASYEELLRQRDELVREREERLGEMRRLEKELQQYRAHAQRTSKLFDSVTSYAEWVRERARSDAELVLRKARARVEKLGDLERQARARVEELDSLERDREQMKRELLRLQALTDETRTRLSGFLTASLEVLNADVEAAQEGDSKPAIGDLQDTLRRELASASLSAPAQVGEAERLEP